MKKNVCIIALLLIVSGFTMELVAQENIHAVLKKCENNKNVDITYTNEKKVPLTLIEDDDPLFGRHETYQVVIRGDEATLIKEFEVAFKKDREKANKISESKKGGKLTAATYQFNRVTYSFIFLSKEESKTTTSARTNFSNSLRYSYSNPINPAIDLDSIQRELQFLIEDLQNK